MAESTASSRGHTSSPSPSASVSTLENQPKKRTRASKPKVRTGCITCKIRRVKCGEEKPACYRCTSTGRTCDGYDNGTPLRNRTPQESLQEAELARAEFLRAYQWNEAARSMRPIVADIEGTEMEKKFFHRFRTATESSFSTHHMCTFTPFWIRLAPGINHHDEAVKHAAIALGAAHHLYQPPGDPMPDGLTPEKIEVFIIQQYNKSISKLQHHVGSSSPESIQVTLVCCLAYICLETLRSSHKAVVTHLLNGLKILQSLPPATFDFLADPRSFAPSPRDAMPATDKAQLDMVDIIQIFGKLEYSACFFVTGVHPVVAERGYSHRRFNDGAQETPFANLRDAQGAIVCFTRDVMARVYEVGQQSTANTQNTHSPHFFWADPSQQRQQACLRDRGRRLETLLVNDFLTRPGALPGTGAPDTPEVLCFYINLLHFRCAQLLLSGIEQSIPTTSPGSPATFSPPLSPWQQHHPIHQHRQLTPTDNLLFDQNLDPQLAAHTLLQMQLDTPGPDPAAQFGGHNESLPTTPNLSTTTNNAPHPLPFPFLPFSSKKTTPLPPTDIARLHEIIHLADILHRSPSAKKFRSLLRGGNVNTNMASRSGSSSHTPQSITPTTTAPTPTPATGIYTQQYSYSFTSDTGLMGPLSLVALAAGSEDKSDEVKNLRKTALRILREYVCFDGGGGDDVCEREGEREGVTIASAAAGDGDGAADMEGDDIDSSGSGRFWMEYFGRLGFVEALPGVAPVVGDRGDGGEDGDGDGNGDGDVDMD